MVCRTYWMVILPAGLFAAATLGAQDQSPQGEGKDLPEGKGEEIVASVCKECHSLERLTSSTRTLQEWKSVVEDMVSNGAALKPEEVEIVVQYLAKNFGPANAQARLQQSAGLAVAPQSAFKPLANVYQLMKAIIIPSSDVVWQVAMEPPKDGQEWTAVQNSALTLAEAGNLLMIGNRAKDQGNWMKAAQALADSATVVFRAAEARDVDALNEAGNQLVRVCRNCHQQYKQSPPR